MEKEDEILDALEILNANQLKIMAKLEAVEDTADEIIEEVVEVEKTDHEDHAEIETEIEAVPEKIEEIEIDLTGEVKPPESKGKRKWIAI